MKRLAMVIEITQELARDHDADELRAFVEAPVHWYARGPRGGVYEGTGPRQIVATNADPECFMRNVIRVYVRSEGAKYLRPGTKARYAADEALA